MSQHDEDMFADVIKGAMERGIDVPKLIADVLRKRSRESPPAADDHAREKETHAWLTR